MVCIGQALKYLYIHTFNPLFCSVHFRESQNELDSLTHLIESMWTHYEPTISPNNLNLDQIFSFLHEERVAESKGAKHDNKTLDEITDELNELNTLLSEDMVSTGKVRGCNIFVFLGNFLV